MTPDEKIELEQVTKNARKDLELLMDTFPELANLLLYFATITIKYESGRYSITEFLNKFTVLSDLILESMEGERETKGSDSNTE